MSERTVWAIQKAVSEGCEVSFRPTTESATGIVVSVRRGDVRTDLATTATSLAAARDADQALALVIEKATRDTAAVVVCSNCGHPLDEHGTDRHDVNCPCNGPVEE